MNKFAPPSPEEIERWAESQRVEREAREAEAKAFSLHYNELSASLKYSIASQICERVRKAVEIRTEPIEQEAQLALSISSCQLGERYNQGLVDGIKWALFQVRMTLWAELFLPPRRSRAESS